MLDLSRLTVTERTLLHNLVTDFGDPSAPPKHFDQHRLADLRDCLTVASDGATTAEEQIFIAEARTAISKIIEGDAPAPGASA